MTSLARLTSISTQTLSLLLERQRSQTLPSFNGPDGSPNNSNATLHLEQIRKNLTLIRAGILELERRSNVSAGEKEATKLLRRQFVRMHGMVGTDIGVQGYVVTIVFVFLQLCPPSYHPNKHLHADLKQTSRHPRQHRNASR